MAYCEVEDVKARAGVLKDAWDDTTPVTDGDIERFIRDAGAVVDMAFGAHGFPVPAADTNVLTAVVPVVADIALLSALTATWPGGDGPAAVRDLIGQVTRRVEGYTSALADGQIDFILYLSHLETGGGAGAGAFWSTEGGYSAWLDDIETGRLYLQGAGAYGFRSPTGPSFHKDMKL